MKPSGVLICLPAYGQMVQSVTTESLFSLAQWLTMKEIRNRMLVFSAADIVEVRNLFLTVWYDAFKEFSHMLFVDADMGFPTELVRDMLKFDKPLLGCLYARRQMTPSVVGAALHENHTAADVVHGFLPANYVGGGVMMIQRRMMDEMLAKKPELSDVLPSVLSAACPVPLKRLIRAFDTINRDTHRLSEDVSFCYRWREECGGEVWANVSHKISHVGPFDFHLRYGGVLDEKAKLAAAEKEAA